MGELLECCYLRLWTDLENNLNNVTNNLHVTSLNLNTPVLYGEYSINFFT